MVNKTMLFVALAIVVIASGYFVSTEFSIAKDVGFDSTDYRSAIDDAFDSCNTARASLLSEGTSCEACALSCSSVGSTKQSDGSYTVDLSKLSTTYTGFYTNVDCDYLSGSSVSSHQSSNPSYYKPVGAPLSVKSYCFDTIRVCEIQVGNAEVVSEEDIDHGIIQRVRYAYAYADCDSDEIIEPKGYTYKYRLVCDSNAYASGDKLDSDKSDLGSCFLTSSPDPDASSLSASVTSLNVASSAIIDSELNVRGVVEAQSSGTYFVVAQIIDSSAAVGSFSVGTSFTASNPCSNSLQTAGIFINMNAGDQEVVDISLRTPSVAGGHKVAFIVTDSCSNIITYDYEIKDLELQSKEDFVDDSIDVIITEEPDFYEDYVEDLLDGFNDELDRVDEEGCSDEDLIVDGCPIAYCDVDGNVVLNDVIECDDGTTVDPKDLTGGFVGEELSFGQKIFYFGEGGYGRSSVIVIAIFVAGVFSIFAFSNGDSSKSSRGRK